MNVGYNPCAFSLWLSSPHLAKVTGMKLEIMDLKLALSTNIKKHRQMVGLSQEKLALTAGLDRSYMSEVERCLANPSIDALLRISNALNISPADLLIIDLND